MAVSAPGNALPRPCSPAEAIQRAVKHVGRGTYGLGKGGYDPKHPDDPFANANGIEQADCWAYSVSYAYKLPLHRPGFNRGAWATVADDVNCDSGIEQAEHRAEVADVLFEVVDRPELGDLLVFPSVRGPDGKRIRIGHVGIVVGLCAEWDPAAPQFGALEVVQCQASRKPAVIRGPGSGWMFRESFKGAVDPRWRTRLLRVVP